jgi:hypothetical protein
VLERIRHHRSEHPHLSLGVVAFSSSQQDEIREMVDAAADIDLDLGRGDDRLDGLFIKNLENVQGDERDIIIFSVGYGRDEDGRFTRNLGPLSRKETGWRRLNVAITRSRQRVEIVTSIVPSDLGTDLDNRSLTSLRNYLEYAFRSTDARSEVDVDRSSRGVAEDISSYIRRLGYGVQHDVGMGDTRIDIAVPHSSRPGDYLLGVELERSLTTAPNVTRDRDRLRPSVLAGLGWKLHRVSTTAWLNDREREQQRLRARLEEAAAIGTGRDSRSATSRPVAPRLVITPREERPTWATTYPVASPDGSTRYSYEHTASRASLSKVISEIVAVEGPVHQERLYQLTLEAWGRPRSVAATKHAFASVLHSLEVKSVVESRGSFVGAAGQVGTTVRVPSNDPASIRLPKHVPSNELMGAVIGVVGEAGEVEVDELRKHIARLFGWNRTGSDIAALIDDAIERASLAGLVSVTSGVFAPRR